MSIVGKAVFRSGGSPGGNPLSKWDRAGLTWCTNRGPLKCEVSRQRNPNTDLIEWRIFAWRGDDRADVLMDGFTGQDLHEALAMANDALEALQP